MTRTKIARHSRRHLVLASLGGPQVQRTGKASLSCFLLLGRLYFQSGPAEKAVATLQQVLDIQKENVEACLLMGGQGTWRGGLQQRFYKWYLRCVFHVCACVSVLCAC